jgi:cytochrome c-type biogenesis protein CcmH/NrfF
MRGLLNLIVVLLALAAALPAVAVQPDEVLADATLEARARALSKELRCMVCQNQSIDDSDAPFARCDIISESPGDFSGIRTPRADSRSGIQFHS